MTLWPPAVFEQKLREVGASAYHHKHPFHLRMNEGRLSAEAVRDWVANRFYYQVSIPLKDAAILSRCPLREVRRLWLHRITDHDGIEGGDEGGIEAWLRLGEACGVPRAEMLDERHLLPGVRFAVDAYVNLARTARWPIAIASSLTEMFAPDLMKVRLAAFEQHYRWVDPAGLDYFRRRITQGRRDSGEGLALTIQHCHTRELQEEAVAALRFKCDVLWTVLDPLQARHPESAP
jgi:pyrroloquinoline-quinone synthase